MCQWSLMLTRWKSSFLRIYHLKKIVALLWISGCVSLRHSRENSGGKDSHNVSMCLWPLLKRINKEGNNFGGVSKLVWVFENDLWGQLLNLALIPDKLLYCKFQRADANTACHKRSLLFKDGCPDKQRFLPDSRLAVKLAAVNSYLAGFIGM